MSERLVVRKSPRQRAVENVLLHIVPILATVVGRTLADGPAPLAGLLGFVLVYFIPAIGSSILIRSGRGELVAPDVNLRNLRERIISAGPFLGVLRLWLFYTIWMGSLFAAIASFDFRDQVVLLALLAPAFGLAAAIFAYWQTGRSLDRPVAETDAPLQPQSLRSWLREFLPLHYACTIGGLGSAYFAGLPFDWPANGTLLIVGLIGGAVVRALAGRELFKGKRELLWIQLGFGEALEVAVLQTGIPFAALWMLGAVEMGLGLAEGAVAGLAGLVLGTLLLILLWVAARLGSSRARRA
ncbi:MAG: hypothetical protein JSR60_07490 [Proteobacteria bacterium]|nr:hypothetical protein [Pseudomonadota bacterium]